MIIGAITRHTLENSRSQLEVDLKKYRYKNMKKISYIAYKILNAFFVFITPKTRPGSRRQRQNEDFYFDFSHHTVHLGDRLFYLDAFKAISELGKSVYISQQDSLTSAIINKIDPTIKIRQCEFSPEIHTLVIPAQALLFSFKRYTQKCCYIIVKYNKSSQENISKQLCKLLELPYSPFYKNIKRDNTVNSKGYVVLSNYIDSGFFRKFFIDEKKIYRKAEKLKKSGHYIIHVGTSNDKLSDDKIYDFIDRDARGQLTIPDLISLIRDQRPTIISYDNFLMHLGILFSCEVYVLFRGRFTKKSKDFHFKNVNECLREENGYVRYL